MEMVNQQGREITHVQVMQNTQGRDLERQVEAKALDLRSHLESDMLRWSAAMSDKKSPGWTEQHLGASESLKNDHVVPVQAQTPTSILAQSAHMQKKRPAAVLGMEGAEPQGALEVLQSLEEMKMMLGELHLAAKEGLRPPTSPQLPVVRSEPSCRGFQPPGGDSGLGLSTDPVLLHLAMSKHGGGGAEGVNMV